MDEVQLIIVAETSSGTSDIKICVKKSFSIAQLKSLLEKYYGVNVPVAQQIVLCHGKVRSDDETIDSLDLENNSRLWICESKVAELAAAVTFCKTPEPANLNWLDCGFLPQYIENVIARLSSPDRANKDFMNFFENLGPRQKILLFQAVGDVVSIRIRDTEPDARELIAKDPDRFCREVCLTSHSTLNEVEIMALLLLENEKELLEPIIGSEFPREIVYAVYSAILIDAQKATKDYRHTRNLRENQIDKLKQMTVMEEIRRHINERMQLNEYLNRNKDHDNATAGAPEGSEASGGSDADGQKYDDAPTCSKYAGYGYKGNFFEDESSSSSGPDGNEQWSDTMYFNKEFSSLIVADDGKQFEEDERTFIIGTENYDFWDEKNNNDGELLCFENYAHDEQNFNQPMKSNDGENLGEDEPTTSVAPEFHEMKKDEEYFYPIIDDAENATDEEFDNDENLSALLKDAAPKKE